MAIYEGGKEDWNEFVLKQGGGFLQSLEWAEFQKSLGRKTFFLKGKDWAGLIIKYNLPLGKSYLYCPRGPLIISELTRDAILIRHRAEMNLLRMQGFLREVKHLAKQENAIFLRIEPTFEISREDLRGLGFSKTKDIQPSRTLILNLDRSEEELLAAMHEKTRYNINLAQRKGVTIRRTEYNEKDFEEFWSLLNQTAKRQGIKIFEKEYYRKQLQIGNNSPHPPLNLRGGENTDVIPSLILRESEGELNFENLLFLAQYQGKTIAANLVNIFNSTAIYIHGGSDNESRSLMAPHLLQWEQIKFVKNQGCKYYDFWGYDEQKWPGVSRFKKGFGGYEVAFCGTHNYIFNRWWYKIYKATRNILR
ncbi:MAG: peptidoglycan bridge formation glycyltransferase FemA/FemB family protein [Candidatus Portnoybacteria bacterium]|nr:peptidoglycan bridge formation glycyltransferase FemA/FemB family protein [Candidatus Portnoybacteria bacterium]